MGISTVSGPFRSKNGFQELVDGVWTPIGGGGGSAIIAAPNGTDLVFTEPGQIITVVGFNPDNIPDNYIFNITTSSGLPTIYHTIVHINPNTLDNVFMSGNGIVTFSSSGSLQLTFVYQGDAVDGFYGPTSYISATGYAISAA